MSDIISLIRENIMLFDIFFLIFLIYFSTQCFAKGFVLSLFSFLKWVLALIITIVLVPKIEPYVSDFVKSKYISGIGLGIFVYILTIFALIMLGKSLARLFSYAGLGSVDKIFGLFFGIFKGYVFFVCVFSIVSWFYPHQKWNMSLNKSYFFPIVEKGSTLLIQEFPNKKDIDDTKKEIENI